MCLICVKFAIIKKPLVPSKWLTINLINVQSCNSLLRVLTVCINSYLKWVSRNRFLILLACHLDTLYFACLLSGHSLFCLPVIWTLSILLACYLDTLYFAYLLSGHSLFCLPVIWTLSILLTCYLDTLYFACLLSGHSLFCLPVIWTLSITLR